MTDFIQQLTLDETTIRYRNPEVAYEREMAIRDLLHHNLFRPIMGEAVGKGPFTLHLSAVDQKLYISIRAQQAGDNADPHTFILSTRGFRKIIKDYFLIWEAYSAGLASLTPEKLQALDMGRRSVHDEGAQLLRQQMAAEIEVDENTARRLFTLICILHLS